MISDYILFGGWFGLVTGPKIDTQEFILNLTSDFSSGWLVRFLSYHYMISDYGLVCERCGLISVPKLGTQAFTLNPTSDLSSGRLVWFLSYHYMISDYGQLLWVVWASFGAETRHLGIHSESKLKFQFRQLVWFLIYHNMISFQYQLLRVVWASFGAESRYLGIHFEPNIRFQFRQVSLVFDLSLYDFKLWPTFVGGQGQFRCRNQTLRHSF